MAKAQKGGKGSRKIGRNKRKVAAKTNATSYYVRGKIDFDTYAKAVGISRKSR